MPPLRDAAMRRTLLTCLVASAALGALGASAVHGQVLMALGDPVAQSDLLFFGHHAQAAYDVLTDHLAGDPADVEALWRAARAAVVVSIPIEDNRARNRYLDPALDFAKRATELAPDDLNAVYWRGVAAGRRALNASAGYASELAEVVYADAHLLLSADSTNAAAHNMLGKLNYEVMTLSRVERMMARTFMGNAALSDASWEHAEQHLLRAVELAPEVVLYQLDLAVLYERRNRPADAIAHLREAVRLPAVQEIDQGIQEEAARRLDELNG